MKTVLQNPDKKNTYMDFGTHPKRWYGYTKLTVWVAAQFQLWIRRMYQRIRYREDFLIGMTEVPVHKGKMKYTLLFLETKAGTLKFNLGRYGIREQMQSEEDIQPYLTVTKTPMEKLYTLFNIKQRKHDRRQQAAIKATG